MRGHLGVHSLYSRPFGHVRAEQKETLAYVNVQCVARRVQISINITLTKGACMKENTIQIFSGV